jgi:hypothetical protein
MKQLREVQTERKERRKAERAEVLRLRDYHRMMSSPGSAQYEPARSMDSFIHQPKSKQKPTAETVANKPS